MAENSIIIDIRCVRINGDVLARMNQHLLQFNHFISKPEYK